MKRVIRHIQDIATGRNLLLLGSLFFLLALLIMPAAYSDLKLYSRGVPPLDLSFYYSPVVAMQHLDAYGDEGRKLYLFTQLTAGLVYPVVYTLFFCALFGWLSKKLPFAPNEKWTLLPLFILVFDWLENACIAWLLVQYPVEITAVAALAGAFTTLKWLSLLLTIGVVAVLGIRFCVALRHTVSLKSR